MEDWFGKLVKKKLGNGASISLWEEVWIGNVPLKSLFPRLYRLSDSKHATINGIGRWVSSWWVWEWEWRWKRPLRSWEEEMTTELLNPLADIVPKKNCTNKWIWLPESLRASH